MVCRPSVPETGSNPLDSKQLAVSVTSSLSGSARVRKMPGPTVKVAKIAPKAKLVVCHRRRPSASLSVPTLAVLNVGILAKSCADLQEHAALFVKDLLSDPAFAELDRLGAS
jgi:hypothetical protein